MLTPLQFSPPRGLIYIGNHHTIRWQMNFCLDPQAAAQTTVYRYIVAPSGLLDFFLWNDMSEALLA